MQNMSTQIKKKRLPQHSWLYNRCLKSPKFDILQTPKLILLIQQLKVLNPTIGEKRYNKMLEVVGFGTSKVRPFML